MAAAKTTHRFYQNNHVCTELDGSVTRSIFRHQNSPLALCTSGAEESRSIMAVDNSNTVMSELRDSGKAQFAYTPYGHRTVQGESNNPLAFNGEILDTPTDCYLLGSYRLASPGSYRFYSDDDQSPFGRGGLNSKAYCAGDPVNNVDPTGHFPLSIFLNTAMAITGGAAIGTYVAGALVKDPKTRNILYITSEAFAVATVVLLGGKYLNSRFKLRQPQNRNQTLQRDNQRQQLNTTPMAQDINPQQELINNQRNIIYNQRDIIYNQQGVINNQRNVINGLAPSNRGLLTPSSTNPNVYFNRHTNRVTLPEPPLSYSQVVGPNSVQQRHLRSASLDALDIRGYQRYT